MTRIVLTGGGSAGHVTPNLALLPELKKLGWDIHYIGTYNGIEYDLMADLVPYHSISAGKLRRYFDLQNFTDPFRVMKGMVQSLAILAKLRPKIIFSKGGFVSLPVAVAAKALRIPVILHESDITPGLANKLSLPFSSHLCVTFPETMKYVKQTKATLTGNPIRRELLHGDQAKGYQLCKFNKNKPVILVMGGSLGSVNINNAVRESLPQITKEFQVAHICGKGNLDNSLIDYLGYQQFEYVSKELPDLFAMADFVISRAGANALFELLALRKAHLLIPLSLGASRGDQVLNAESFAKQGFSMVLKEEDLSSATLISAISKLAQERSTYITAMENTRQKDATTAVLEIIKSYVG